MPPKVELETFRTVIEIRYYTGNTSQAISIWLSQQHTILVNARTLERRFQEWGLKKRVKSDYSEECRIRIFTLFYTQCLHDNEIAAALQKEGFQITPLAVADIRQSHGILRRSAKGKAPQISWEQLLKIVDDEFKKGGIRDYGRTLLYAHFRQSGFSIPRYSLAYPIFCIFSFILAKYTNLVNVSLLL